MDRRERSPALAPRTDGARVQKPESAADRMAALKARVAAAISGSQTKGGLNVSLHPALQDIGSAPRPAARGQDTRGQSSRASQSSAAARPSPSLARPTPSRADGENPYFDEATAGQMDGARQRESRQLLFNPKGKFIQQGAALRRQAALEQMKKRIAESTKKMGNEDDVDTKLFAVEAPPEVEWWDEGLVDGYDNLDAPDAVKVGTPDSVVTEYVQHPVLIEPPQNRNKRGARVLYLTRTEQRKLRRQRRMREHKEEQAKQRLGLIPAPPPKVKKGNLMRVLGEEAVKDPTLVEARVNKEIAERRQKHLDANEERKLSKEELREKLAANQQKDAAKGIHVAAFKIGSLANGQHRYRVNVNAEQHALTGAVIMHPRFSLIIAEGGEHSLARYKKLLLDRIDWTENVPSRGRAGTENDGADGGGPPAVRDWLLAEDEGGALKDLARNECKLIFEGEEKTRAFRKWTIKVCETDVEAREVLARAKMETFWSLAKAT